jgi:hypothetical protein
MGERFPLLLGIFLLFSTALSPAAFADTSPKKCCLCVNGQGVDANRFVNRCISWMASQKGCDRKAMVPFESDNASLESTLASLSLGCEEIELQYHGHNNDLMPNRFVSTCLLNNKSCKLYCEKNSGCRTFGDLDFAAGVLTDFIGKLPDDVTVRISGNQCIAATSGESQYNSQATATYTSKGFSWTFESCHIEQRCIETDPEIRAHCMQGAQSICEHCVGASMLPDGTIEPGRWREIGCSPETPAHPGPKSDPQIRRKSSAHAREARDS